jgi:DNA-binding HxlR family transcriptional regulator
MTAKKAQASTSEPNSGPAPKRTVNPSSRIGLQERNCSVGRTIDTIGDGWTFMVLRECYFGARRFEEFKSVLGLPRSTLTARLRNLNAAGLLERVQYSERPPRYEYRLTEAGIDLYAVMLALMTFGDQWLAGPEGKPLQLVHRACGHPCTAVVICSECKQEVSAQRVSYRPGPGAGTSALQTGTLTRRSTDPTALERRRPSSVARALQVIGDRWSFMLIREAFFRVTRFDDFQTNLHIARNILADRLTRLVKSGVFDRIQYQTGPDRFEYRLTKQGKALFGPMIAMLRWGDDWLADGKPPLVLRHLDCGKDFRPTVACDQCLSPIGARDMKYVMNYKAPAEFTGEQP